MQITVPCDHCAHENDLGRIFCSRCGERLNPQALSPNEVGRRLNEQRAPQRLKNVMSVVLFLLVVACGVAFWPIPHGGSPGDARQGQSFAAKLDRVNAALARSGKYNRVFSEKDINNYLAFIDVFKATEKQRKKEEKEKKDKDKDKKKKRKKDAVPTSRMCVKFSEESFAFQVRRSFGPIVVGKYQTPRIHFTYTITGEAEEGELARVKASVGHVPFPPPLKYIVLSTARKRISAGLKHEAIFDDVSDVAFKDGKVALALLRESGS